MVSHAKSGGNIEVMGLLQGRIRGDAFLITDCFALPVEGTETRVNAGESANEYMVQFTELNEVTEFSKDTVCGWYHSHPGYGCWLSGIDVATQLLYQSHQDPFVAIVIDPVRTAATGRVEIGAFRAYPENVTGAESKSVSTRSDIPTEKIQDFGVHSKRYYSMDVEFYRSPYDAEVIGKLWDDYWTETLSCLKWDQSKRRFGEDIDRILNKLNSDDQDSMTEYGKQLRKCTCRFVNESLSCLVNSNIMRSFPKAVMDTSS